MFQSISLLGRRLSLLGHRIAQSGTRLSIWFETPIGATPEEARADKLRRQQLRLDFQASLDTLTTIQNRLMMPQSMLPAADAKARRLARERVRQARALCRQAEDACSKGDYKQVGPLVQNGLAVLDQVYA